MSNSTSALDLYCQELDSLESIRSLVEQQQWPAAIEVIEQVVDRFADDADFRILQATAYLNWARTLIADEKDQKKDGENKIYKDARHYLQRGIQAAPTKSNWIQLDRCYRQMERQLGLALWGFEPTSPEFPETTTPLRDQLG